MNDIFIIKGNDGKRALKGTIAVRGAKNAALKALAASFLFKDELVVENVPDIDDIKMMARLLVSLNATVKKIEGGYRVFAPKESEGYFSRDVSKQLRASIVVTGPVLARYGRVSFPHPGGCIIGARPIDLFLDGFLKMGATIDEKEDSYEITAPGGKLKGARIFFKNQSMTATETFIMAAVLAEGVTVLGNCAAEPEIVHLAEYLSLCGAKIEGAGTSTITITGGGPLSTGGTPYVTLPDRLETGSFLILGALSAEDLLITNCEPLHIESTIEVLKQAGVAMEVGKDTIRIRSKDNDKTTFSALDIKTHEYPGFPTDLQAPMAVFLTQANGRSLIFETIFEGRLGYANELSYMGANITVCDPHRVIIEGPTPLVGKKLQSPDIRAGLALLIAAIIAKGGSEIHAVSKIDRGYERIEKRLRSIGVSIQRVKSDQILPVLEGDPKSLENKVKKVFKINTARNM